MYTQLNILGIPIVWPMVYTTHTWKKHAMLATLTTPSRYVPIHALLDNNSMEANMKSTNSLPKSKNRGRIHQN